MITYVNSKEAELFELAAEALGVESLDLDQYLNKLAELKAISPKYVRLPLYEDGHEDEEIFVIDANARTIKVPASFSKNGVGVVSDELAETVWFKINRYFDIKDFGKAAGVVGDELKDGNLHILIQWEAPDGAKGASWAYAIDADTDPEYIYFGWALTAAHLTAKAGNIRFGVRIMEYDGDEIAYSFATQATQIAVKAGLSFDVTDDGVEIESVADKIASRLMGGQIAHCPVFAEDGDLAPFMLNLQGDDSDVLRVEVGAPEGEEYDAIAYKWYRKGPEDEDFVQIEGEYSPALAISASGKYYVVVFGMKEIVDGEEYVYEGMSAGSEGSPAMWIYNNESYFSEADARAAAEADQGELEEGEEYDYSGITPVAEVPATPSEPITPLKKFKYHTSVASSKSTVCEIPMPLPLEITEEMAALLKLDGEDPSLHLIVERQAILVPGEEAPTPVGIVSIGLAKTATADLSEDLEDENAFAEVAVKKNGEEGEALIVYTVSDDGHIDVNMSAEGVAEGFYKLAVINTLNGNVEQTDSSIICRVVHDAGKPAISVALVSSAAGVTEGSCVRGDKLVATCSADGHLSDGLSLQWYEVVGDFDPADSYADKAIEGATEDEFQPEHPGSYYAILTNVVADTTSTDISDVFVFNA